MVIITETGTGFQPDQGHVCLICIIPDLMVFISSQNEGG